MRILLQNNGPGFAEYVDADVALGLLAGEMAITPLSAAGAPEIS